MEGYVTRLEYEEHNKRMDDEHERTNARLKILEEDKEASNKLLVSIEKMAINMENMQKEQLNQGKRLEVLENRDGKMWRKVSGHAITIMVGLVIGYIFSQIGV